VGLSFDLAEFRSRCLCLEICSGGDSVWAARSSRRDVTAGDLPEYPDRAAAHPSDHDSGDRDPGRTGAGRRNLEHPDSDAGVDQQAQLGDREPDAGPDPDDQAQQRDVADPEQDASGDWMVVTLGGILTRSPELAASTRPASRAPIASGKLATCAGVFDHWAGTK
jgi:hypothetical protein